MGRGEEKAFIQLTHKSLPRDPPAISAKLSLPRYFSFLIVFS